MKTKVIVLIVLTLVSVFVTGCIGRNMGKTTGFTYILSRGAEKESAGRELDKNQDKKVIPAISPLEQKSEKRSGPKTVYLTFDDGPNRTETPMILDILDSYGVKGTFFIVGTNVEQSPEVLKDIVRRGHAIGNHTYDHRYSEVYASNAAFMGSVKKNEDIIFKKVGIRPKVVRDPGGEVRNNKVLKGLLGLNGYNLVDWNIDSEDSREPKLDGAQIVESVRRQAAKPQIWPNMIILMHDGKGHLNTVRALPTIIEMLKHQGFEFATME